MRSCLLVVLCLVTLFNQAASVVLNITSIVGVNCSLGTIGASGCGAGDVYELVASNPILDWQTDGRLSRAVTYSVPDPSSFPANSQQRDCSFIVATGSVTCALPILQNANNRDVSYPATFSFNDMVYSFTVMVSDTPPLLKSIGGDCFTDQSLNQGNAASINHFFTGSSIRFTGVGLFPNTRIILTSTIQPSRTYVLGSQGSGFPGDCQTTNFPFEIYNCKMPAVDTADQYHPILVQAASSSQVGRISPQNVTSVGNMQLTGIVGSGCRVDGTAPQCTDNSQIFLTWRLLLPLYNSNNQPTSWIWSSSGLTFQMWLSTRFSWSPLMVNSSGLLASYSGVPADARPAWYDVSISFYNQPVVSTLPASLFVPMTKMEIREIRGCINKPSWQSGPSIFVASACHTGDPLTLVPGYQSNALTNYDICLRSDNGLYRMNNCVTTLEPSSSNPPTMITVLICPFPSITPSDVGIGMMMVDCNTGQLARASSITASYDVQSYGDLVIGSVAGDGCSMGSNSTSGCSLRNYFLVIGQSQLFPSDLANTNAQISLTLPSSYLYRSACAAINTTTARCSMPNSVFVDPIELFPDVDRWMSVNLTIAGVTVLLPSAIYITSLPPVITGVIGCTAMSVTVVNGCYAGSPISVLFGPTLTPGTRLMLVSTIQPGVTYPINVVTRSGTLSFPSLPSIEVNQTLYLQGISSSGLRGELFVKPIISLGNLILTDVVGVNCTISLNPNTTCEGSAITLSGPSIFLGTPGAQYAGANWNDVAESYITLTPRGVCLPPLQIALSRAPFGPSSPVVFLVLINSTSLLLPIALVNTRSLYRGLQLDLSLTIAGATSNVMTNAFMYPTSDGTSPLPIICSSSSTASVVILSSSSINQSISSSLASSPSSTAHSGHFQSSWSDWLTSSSQSISQSISSSTSSDFSDHNASPSLSDTMPAMFLVIMAVGYWFE